MSRIAQDIESSGGHETAGMMRWLITYADMITLLMAFFIMMYSMSVLNQEKFRRAAASLRREFGGEGREIPSAAIGAKLPLAAPAPSALEPPVQSVQEQVEEYIREQHLEDVVRTHADERGLTISVVSDNLLFPVGEAELRPAALAILHRIAGLLKRVPNPVVVEGHTCSLPIRTSRYPSNWELSAARACRVVRHLLEQEQIPARRLAAVGYGDSRPVAANAQEEGRARNRRVDLVILSESAGPAAIMGRAGE